MVRCNAAVFDDLAALAALVRRVGWGKALRVGLGLVRARARGEPFAALPSPADERERSSRDQIGPAVLLVRELRRVGLEPAEALAVAGDAVTAAGVRLMRRSIGPLRRADLESMPPAARLVFLQERATRFPNADVTFVAAPAGEVRFVARRCCFPRLCAAAGEPDVAALACAVDEAFFGGVEPDVELERPTTQARGAQECPFTLRWKP